jgi:glycosyltransferase involved in cell wall biosynthesis
VAVQTPTVSVVVATRNGASQLPSLFTALEHQTASLGDVEIIIVDDGSEDGTMDVAEASGIAKVIHTDPIGLPRARNIGIRAAHGDIIAITDADVVPEPTWIERGVARTRATGADILGGPITVALPEKPSIAALVDVMNWFNQKACVKQGFAIGATIWAPRRTFERWGLFNEQLASYGHEDAEWGQRATGSGARLVYEPDVRVTHPPRARLRDVARKAYKLGYGLAPLRRLPFGTIRDLPPLFLRPTPYLPPREIALERLRELGQHPTRAQIALIYLTQWLFVRLPRLAGDAMGELSYRRRRQTTDQADGAETEQRTSIRRSIRALHL